MSPTPGAPTAFDRTRIATTRRLTKALLSLPAPLVTPLAGGPPPCLDGQRLDPQLHALLAVKRALRLPDLEDLPIEAARHELVRQTRLVEPEPAPLAAVEALEVPGAAGPLAARLYVPHAATTPGPLLVYLHGGGFVLGGLDSHDAALRALASRARVRTLAVAYRLAPEARFPAAYEDAIAAWRWAVESTPRLGACPGRLAIGGDSAGANLAVGVALAARDGRAPLPTFVLLVYPALDLTRSAASHRTFARGFLLTAALMDRFVDGYLTHPEEAEDARASPSFATDLRGLPPTLLVTAGFDPLRDEGRRFVYRLRDAGVPTRYHHYASLLHGFVTMTGAVAEARRAWDEAAAVLREALR